MWKGLQLRESSPPRKRHRVREEEISGLSVINHNYIKNHDNIHKPNFISNFRNCNYTDLELKSNCNYNYVSN